MAEIFSEIWDINACNSFLGSISAQKLCILLTLIYCKDFFVILQYEQVQEVHGNYINGFYKNPFQGDWARLGLKNGASSKFVLL